MTQDVDEFKEKFYAPLNFLAWSNDGEKFTYKWDPNMLKNLNSNLNRRKLEERGWEIHETEVPDSSIKKLHELCFEKTPKKSKIEKLIEDIIYTSIESCQSDEENSDQ